MQGSSRDVVWDAMQDGVAHSDAAIERLTGLSHSKVSGARVALWEKGLVERVGKGDDGLQLWQLCPSERREQAELACRDHQERLLLARLMNKDPGARASIVIELLSSKDVSTMVTSQLERRKHFRRIQARVKDVQADRVAASRDRKRQIAELEADADTLLTFLVMVDRLRDSVDVLLGMRQQVAEEDERLRRDEPARIGSWRWSEVARNVREVLEVARVVYGKIGAMVGEPIDSCPLCGARLGSVRLELEAGDVDATTVDEDDPAQNVIAGRD